MNSKLYQSMKYITTYLDKYYLDGVAGLVSVEQVVSARLDGEEPGLLPAAGHPAHRGEATGFLVDGEGPQVVDPAVGDVKILAIGVDHQL